MPVSRCSGFIVALLCALGCVVGGVSGCAKGFSASAKASPPPPVEMAGAQAMTEPKQYKGNECTTVGERVPCVCSDGSGEGIKSCASDANSPTMGTFSECVACAPVPKAGTAAMPETPAPAPAGTMGRGMRAAAGTSSTTAGTGSTTSDSSGARAGSGAAGRTSTASAGRSGGTTTRGSGRCNCVQDCFPIGILACCRLDNSCGCSWAPGAYCL